MLKAIYWGTSGACRNYQLQIANLLKEARSSLGETPVIIGECGVPMDMKYVLDLLLKFFV